MVVSLICTHLDVMTSASSAAASGLLVIGATAICLAFLWLQVQDKDIFGLYLTRPSTLTIRPVVGAEDWIMKMGNLL